MAGRHVVVRCALAMMLLAAACTSGNPDDVGTDGQATSASEDVTGDARSTTGTSTQDPIESSVGTSTSDVVSDVEVRVAETISDFDGETTEVGTVLTVPGDVLFDFDESTLRPDARADLDRIVEVIAFYEDAPVEIVGHTDSQGSDEYNQGLSEDRANAVAAYLRDAGIAGGRMTVEGRGESEPRQSNDTEAGRQANRRVEITVVGVEPPDVD